MAKEVLISIKVDDAELSALEGQLEDIGADFRTVENEAKGVNSQLEEAGKNGGLIATLDRFTGGLASQMRDAAEATKVFNFSLKGLRGALVATGIGALVVALGLIVAYWDDITDFITGSNSELEKQLRYYEQIGDEQEQSLALLDSSDEILKEQGKSQEEINKLKEDEINALIEIQKGELEIQKNRLKGLKDLQTAGGSGLEAFFRSVSSVTLFIAEQIDKIFGKLGFDTGFGQAAFDANNTILEGIFGTQAEIDETQQAVDDLELSLRNLENRAAGIRNQRRQEAADTEAERIKKILDERRAEIEGFTDFNQEILDTLDNQVADYLGSTLGTIREGAKEIVDTNKDAAEDVALLWEDQLAIVGGALRGLGALFAENAQASKAIQTATAIIDGIVAVQKTLSSVPWPLNLVAAAGIAAQTLANVRQIQSTQIPGAVGGTGGASIPGIGAGAIPTPQFNVVGDTGINQLNETIGRQTEEPARAYVVFDDIKTAGRLDREAVNSSTV